MNELLLLQGIIERGLLFSLVIMGMYLTSRVIKCDDLTVEGSFGLGGAITAQLLVHGFSSGVSLMGAVIAGSLAGLATGLLYTRLNLNNLISGIVVTSALFSLNLKIAGSQIALGPITTIFMEIPDSLFFIRKLVILSFAVGIIFIALDWFLRTQIGYLLYATGDNQQMLINLGKNPQLYQIAALMISNALTAFTGALFVHYVGYFSIWTSVGMLIMALAGLIMSESIQKGFGIQILLGSLFYQSIIALTFELNIDQDLNKCITALLIVLLIGFKKVWRKDS